MGPNVWLVSGWLSTCLPVCLSVCVCLSACLSACSPTPQPPTLQFSSLHTHIPFNLALIVPRAPWPYKKKNFDLSKKAPKVFRLLFRPLFSLFPRPLATLTPQDHARLAQKHLPTYNTCPPPPFQSHQYRLTLSRPITTDSKKTPPKTL